MIGKMRLGDRRERLTHHHGLLDQGVTVLAHVLQDLVGCIVAGCCGRLGSHRKRVDEGLKQTEEHLQRAEDMDWCVLRRMAKKC